METDPFVVASHALIESSERVHELAHPFLQLLPVSGASISTFGPLLGSETVSATDERAERVDEIQFDLGEGPCWDALTTRRPVLEPDFVRSTAWPLFSRALRYDDIRALFAFPLTFGPLGLGAIDMYSVDAVSLSPEQQQQTRALSDIVSRIILHHAVDRSDMPDIVSPYSRRLIHQATGMVLAQMKIQADDAYLLLQARAFAENRPMHDIAQDVVARRIRFTSNSNTEPTEETP